MRVGENPEKDKVLENDAYPIDSSLCIKKSRVF